MIKRLLYGFFVWMSLPLNAQQVNCTFKEPVLTITFGSGRVPDLNTEDPSTYTRVARYCPSDGHYTYTPYTGDCFSGDWLTLSEDHTPGDADGNMMIVNASYYSGAFLKTPVLGLKGGTIYEFSVWMMNVCRPTDKCPFPLLPNISIVLQTPDGKVVFQQGIGELARSNEPHWNRYQTMFTTPAAGNTSLMLTMIDNSPGGCGNDFALDDISFRECIKIPPPVIKPVKNTPPPKKPEPKITPKKEPVAAPKPVVKKDPVLPKPPPKKDTIAVKPVPKPAPKPEPVKPPVPKKDTVAAKPAPKKQPPAPKPAPRRETPPPVQNEPPVRELARPPVAVLKDSTPTLRRSMGTLPAPPLLLKTRSNPVIRQLEVLPGELKVDLYDNGEIDGDTITIFHNNVLVVSHARLSQKPVSFTITLNPEHPHHELVMVAENLGSIPPNTSLMVITTPDQQRYEVFISSTEQKNAKVVIDLKQ